MIELAAIGPVPFATHIFRQLGAQVLVVSPPDDRGLGIPIPQEHDYLSYGKDNVVLDLKSDEGHAGLFKLLASTDVLLEGFRPGTLERLNLCPEDLRLRFPALVVARCSGWASGSPQVSTAGHDINYLALSGALGAIGTEKPTPPLNLVADYGGAAMHLAVGVISALYARQRDGQGAVVETSIFEGVTSLMTLFYSLFDAGMWKDSRCRNLLDGGAPFYCCYKCADGKWIAVGAIEEKFYSKFVLAIGADLDPSKQYDQSGWMHAHSVIAACIAKRSRDEWSSVFYNTDCCCSPVLDLSEVRTHPDVAPMFDGQFPKPPIRFFYGRKKHGDSLSS